MYEVDMSRQFDVCLLFSIIRGSAVNYAQVKNAEAQHVYGNGSKG